MHRINMAYLRRLKVPKGTPMPKPFPGRFPTRIFVVWIEGGLAHTYIGKPSSMVIAKVGQHPSRVSYFAEFDRAYKIVLIGTSVKPTNCKHLLAIYHPGAEDPTGDPSFVSRYVWLAGLIRPQRSLDGKFTYYRVVLQDSATADLEKQIRLLINRPKDVVLPLRKERLKRWPTVPSHYRERF